MRLRLALWLADGLLRPVDRKRVARLLDVLSESTSLGAGHVTKAEPHSEGLLIVLTNSVSVAGKKEPSHPNDPYHRVGVSPRP